jgi:hypothetical protein
VTWTLRRRTGRWLTVVALVGMCVLGAPAAYAQQLLDRVVARVAGVAITQTDVEAAIGLGVIRPEGPDRLADGTRQLIDRRLLLTEVARFPPAEPPDTAVDQLAMEMKAYAGAAFEALRKKTGIDDQRIREMARDTLRIQAYVDQRFGTTAQVSPQEARDYYDAHRQEFTRNGALQPFEQVEAEARRAASAERRRRLVAQWVTDLRMRGDVVDVTSRP